MKEKEYLEKKKQVVKTIRKALKEGKIIGELVCARCDSVLPIQLIGNECPMAVCSNCLYDIEKEKEKK